MADQVLGTNVVTQVAIVVRDIDKTSRAWAQLLGVPVPDARLTDPEPVANTRYRGEPTKAQAKLAFFRLGSVSLELIEPVGRPSTWGDFLDEHGEGIHHIAFNVKGMDGVLTKLAEINVPLIQRGDYTGGRYAYVDGVPELGAILELLEND